MPLAWVSCAGSRFRGTNREFVQSNECERVAAPAPRCAMRPWRLTRRARVEMEAALGALRHDVHPRTGCHYRGVYRAARLFCDARSIERLDIASGPARQAWRLIEYREWRILRARVALALRAALRADEDARCEEARARVGAAFPYASEVADYVEGSDTGVDAMREWPPLGHKWRATTDDDEVAFVPRALWEARR